MTNEERLALVKANLEISNKLRDVYLTHLIEVAEAEIKREGITLKDTTADEGLVVMYASYLYRKRTGDEQGMPRMLRYALNNRLLSEKMGE